MACRWEHAAIHLLPHVLCAVLRPLITQCWHFVAPRIWPSACANKLVSAQPTTCLPLCCGCAVLRQLPSLLDLCVDSNPFTAASRNKHPAATAAAAATGSAGSSSSNGAWYREAVLLAACTPALLRLDGQTVSGSRVCSRPGPPVQAVQPPDGCQPPTAMQSPGLPVQTVQTMGFNRQQSRCTSAKQNRLRSVGP